MKQVTFIVIAWLLSIPLIAQPTGNKFFIGGHFSFYGTVDKSKDGSTTEKDGSTTYFYRHAGGGLFLK